MQESNGILKVIVMKALFVQFDDIIHLNKF